MPWQTVLEVGSHISPFNGKRYDVSEAELDSVVANYDAQGTKVIIRNDPNHLAARDENAPVERFAGPGSIQKLKRVGSKLLALIDDVVLDTAKALGLHGISVEVHPNAYDRNGDGEKRTGPGLLGAVFTNAPMVRSATFSTDSKEKAPDAFTDFHRFTTEDSTMANKARGDLLALYSLDPKADDAALFAAIDAKNKEQAQAHTEALAAKDAEIIALSNSQVELEGKVKTLSATAEDGNKELMTLSAKVQLLEKRANEVEAKANQDIAEIKWLSLYEAGHLTSGEFNKQDPKGQRWYAAILEPATRDGQIEDIKEMGIRNPAARKVKGSNNPGGPNGGNDQALIAEGVKLMSTGETPWSMSRLQRERPDIIQAQARDSQRRMNATSEEAIQ